MRTAQMLVLDSDTKQEEIQFKPRQLMTAKNWTDSQVLTAVLIP